MLNCVNAVYFFDSMEEYWWDGARGRLAPLEEDDRAWMRLGFVYMVYYRETKRWRYHYHGMRGETPVQAAVEALFNSRRE